VLNEYAGILIGQGTTDDKGQFNTAIDLKTQRPVILFIGNIFFVLWVNPNTTLTIQENAAAHYDFSGTTANENTVLLKSGLMQPYKVSADIHLDSFEPGKHLHYLDSIENDRLQVLNEVDYKNSISEKFLSYYKTDVYSSTFFNKNQYPALLKATNKITDKDIPKDYFNFWDKFKLNDDSTVSNSYANALQNFIEYKTLQRIGKNKAGTEQSWFEIFRTADTLLQQYPLSLQKQKTAYLLVLIKYFNYSDITSKEIDNYKQQFPFSPSLSFIDNLWQKKQGSASVSPSFRLKNNEGRFVDIRDFIGKVIYVDFWGSWCKACILNMPHAEFLREKFKGKDVVFLYLDFYDTQEKWLTAIKKNNIDGTHLKAEKSDEEYFEKIFSINQGFPRYALIDKKGKLITISAPSPNKQDAYDLIKKYLDDL
jgi:thiol-disulfide isomerase/thioredoxin